MSLADLMGGDLDDEEDSDNNAEEEEEEKTTTASSNGKEMRRVGSGADLWGGEEGDVLFNRLQRVVIAVPCYDRLSQAFLIRVLHLGR